MSKESLSKKLFFKINNQLGQRRRLDALMVFCAHWLIFILGAGVLCWGLAVFEPMAFKQYIKLLLTAMVCGIAASWLTACFVRKHRPVTEFPNLKLLLHPHQVWKAFPSDHALLSFILATIPVLVGAPWWLAVVFLSAAGLISFGRVYVGVHYPRDVIGGIIYGLFFAVIAYWLLANLTQPAYNFLIDNLV
ncbi:MAG: phosphatase PAP2 family protein [Candidatus Magasanikbacteria bacterium]|nr:phosphatase PAP2 family protein [Candidatus Magasanikbacteria bacterium]